MLRTVVRQIEVVRQLRVFRGNGVDTFHAGQDAEFFTPCPYAEVVFFHVAVRLFDEAGNLEVGESESFGFTQHFGRQVFDAVVLLQYAAVIYDVFQFVQEPRVDFRQFVDTLDRISFFQCLCYGKDTQIGRVFQLVVKVLEREVVVTYKPVHALSDHTQAFLHNLFKRFTDRHDFADRFHAGADLAAHTRKLRQVPARDLGDQIIDLGGLVGRVGCTHFADLIERVTERQLGCHKRQRVAAGFRG